MARKQAVSAPVLNHVVISDLHVGCQLGLLGPDGGPLDNGGTYMPSPFQQKIYLWWREFWDEFVPSATKGEPYDVIVNGDTVDGVHHNSTSQWTHNLTDQAKAAHDLLLPIARRCSGRFYMTRGTECHVGQSGSEEERLAKELGAVKSPIGQYARYDLWKRLGPRLVHYNHHIGTTGSQHYESTAVHKELLEAQLEAGRWERPAPDVVVRSHRHRYIETVISTSRGRAYSVVTPAWQGKTGFAFRITGGRLSEPQFGGLVIRFAHDELFIRPWVKSLEREQPE